MPLVIDLQLLDEDEGSYHLATGRGIFTEIERQLLDEKSHLRRKSAFGALVTRGASIQFIREEQLCKQPSVSSRAVVPQPASLGTDGTSDVQSEIGAGQNTWAANQSSNPQVGESAGIAKVPHILDFPRPAGRLHHAIPSIGLNVFSSLFDWMPACTAGPCKALPIETIDSCTIVLPPPEAIAPCVPVPTSSKDTSKFEAGVGGWPLCVPQASVALVTSTAPHEASVSCFRGARFRKAAVEVDDHELAVCFVPQHGDHSSCSSLRSVPTPSTASTADRFPTQAACYPLPWMTNNRLVILREAISCVKVVHKSDIRATDACDQSGIRLWEPGCSLFPHFLELTGTPCGASKELTVLLGLPTPSLTSRFHAALTGALATVPGGMQRGLPATETESNQGAVRCELHLSVQLRLDTAGNDVNCAAVVRRGICEACHVGAHRIRVVGMRDIDKDSELPEITHVQANGKEATAAEPAALVVPEGQQPSEHEHAGIQAAAAEHVAAQPNGPNLLDQDEDAEYPDGI